jgi:tRNA A-37 threonylcarbamoyl transferase component Bud32
MSACPPLATAETPAAADLPAAIGRYRVVDRLGEGATSEVFLAEDDFHRRLVAIKRVREPSLGDATGNHYRGHFFAAEAALAGKLEHPNVVRIFDAVDDPVQPYLVMEYVAGDTLRSFCRPDALLSLHQIVEIGFKCAMALDYVARRGLIHRDVKPANILTLLDDAGSVVDVKLTDFGSAFDCRSDRTQVFRVGSLTYMAPEQLDGGPLEARTDMYSLAAVLFHLVAGRPPFDAATPAAVMNQIYHQDPPPLATLRDGVPPRMQALLERALAKDPARRPRDWPEFADEWALLVARREVPLAARQEVLDSERFGLLRQLEFFAGFGDVELWEVVHRARWQRHAVGDALYRKGDTGDSFHIVAQGRIDVYRDGERVARLGTGTSVGEMAYLAPSEDLKVHSADVLVAEAATTVSFTPAALEMLSPATRHLFDRAFIRVLVRRLHAAHEALAHPRRIL